MKTPDQPTVRRQWARARDLAGLIASWGLWAALTTGLFLYIQHYSRNIPFSDEFEIVPVMTGAQPVTLAWAWAQHNEHRPMIPRLIMAGLFRWVSTDFRAARYASAGLLSAMAAFLLVAARRVRGSARLADALLPLAILNAAQCESLLNGYAISLILTSAIAILLTGMAGPARGGDGRGIALTFGLSLVVLPLCGGSGLAMLPPLMLWLAGYVAWGWWSGRRPAGWVRAAGLAFLLAGAAVAALYLRGYARPAYHPLPPSVRAVASSSLKYLSLSVYPSMSGYYRIAGLVPALLVIATLLLLAIAALRTPGERPRALALVSIILSMLSVAAVVGYSRAGFGPGAALVSRYVSLATPLLCVLYIAWLAHGDARARAGIQVGLLALICLAYPGGGRFARGYGSMVHSAERRVERGLRDGAPTALLLDRACPALFPDREFAYRTFRMLKEARIEPFAEFRDDRVAAAPAGAIAR